jgi:hypothetical protein
MCGVVVSLLSPFAMRLQGLLVAILVLSLTHAAYSAVTVREKDREKDREGSCPVKKKSATFSELRSAARDLLVLQGEPLAAASCLQRALKRSQGVVQPKERLAARKELASALQLAARFAQAEIEAEALLEEARTLGDDEELASAFEVRKEKRERNERKECLSSLSHSKSLALSLSLCLFLSSP